MRWTSRIPFCSMLATAVVLVSATPSTAEDCTGDYVACSAAFVSSSTDWLHDSTCYSDYLSCVSRMLRFF